MKSKALTMETVALRAGVSITTVSHVVNKTRNVNQETKDAVLKVMEELNYRALKTAKPGRGSICVGVVLADVREDYYTTMIKAIESVATDYGISAIFCDSEADYEKEKRNIAVLVDRQVSGLLLAPADADRMPGILEKLSIPVVLIDRQYESHNFLSVGINNFHSSYLGVKCIRAKGAKNIGFIGYSDPVSTIRQRILGYKSAMLDFDQSSVPKTLYLKYNGGDSFPLIKQFILDEGFDGLVCATSTLCYELVAVLDTLDPETRERLKIITFDDNRWFDYLKYPVSVISQPVAEIGNAALENLLQMIEQKIPLGDIKRELLFDASIVDR
jgi:LacI family transcriptional regulator